MKRYILLVFCILLGFVYFFIPLAYVERFVGNDGVNKVNTSKIVSV